MMEERTAEKIKQDLEKLFPEARFNGLLYRNEQLAARELVDAETIAARLGRDVAYVEELHKQGKLYAVEIDVEGIRQHFDLASMPAKKVGAIREFIEQGKRLAYPTWQVRDSKQQLLPFSSDLKVYPEVELARAAYAIFAHESSEGVLPEYKQEYESKIPTDADLEGLFDSTCGFSGGSLARQITKHHGGEPMKPPMSTKKLVEAWWYHINPYGGFS